jgi:hypothetical protein
MDLEMDGIANATTYELTEEMIAAGADALSAMALDDLAEGWIPKGEAASRIFVAMMRARLETSRVRESRARYQRVYLPSSVMGKSLT